jgi:hypothetical protein
MRVLKVSRLTVCEVLRSGSSEVPNLPRGEIRTLQSAEPGVTRNLQGKPGAIVGGVANQRNDSELSGFGVNLLLPPRWHRSGAKCVGRTLLLPSS